ncbi:putative alcohol dehydrogenase [Bacteroides coprosuis DSM 18011]|uniref:Putative alcohol dehydrogenase n=1 Tax=Bacteroides coprosuis DSM 18011 TaxID=679937 RepID=F3ZS57_9BACE|nr:DUF2007 domain-containing protein [Bacteroides coprosuis]EGJ72078.1 putative alcohol dehydrogenase [Bacteroides coprosuis DSM 18011]
MDTILLARFQSDYRANLLCSVLKNEGIESFKRNENSATVLAGLPGFEIEVYVFDKDYERAKEIYAEGFPDAAQ